MGGKYKTQNTEKDRAKRRYGFKRASVKQKHRIAKGALEYRRHKRLRCYTKQSYLNSVIINNIPQKERQFKIMELFFTQYNNIENLLRDYELGFRDPLFTRIMYLSNAHRCVDTREIFRENYNDLIIDTLLEFIGKMDNFVESNSSSFYAYMVNIIPYRFTTLFSSLLYKYNSHVDIEEYETVDDTQDPSVHVNELGIYLLKQFKEI